MAEQLDYFAKRMVRAYARQRHNAGECYQCAECGNFFDDPKQLVPAWEMYFCSNECKQIHHDKFYVNV